MREPPTPPDRDLGKLDVLNDNERLLFEPSSAPESLLGRRVYDQPDGRLRIEDVLAPGCTVGIIREPGVGHTRYLAESSRFVSLGLGYTDVAGFQTEHGKSAQIELEIDHAEVLRADLAGPCGEKVITQVKVGTGRRHVFNEGRGSTQGGASAFGTSARGEGGSTKRVGVTREWDRPAAWAFSVGPGPILGDSIDIVMPTNVRVGQPVRPTVEVRRDMWLIILNRDANGDYGLVSPTEDPARAPIFVRAGFPAVLPDFKPSVTPGHEQETVHETLLVYGFIARGDFDAFRPPAGALTQAQKNIYARDLEEKHVRSLPRGRWAFKSFGYALSPAN